MFCVGQERLATLLTSCIVLQAHTNQPAPIALAWVVGLVHVANVPVECVHQPEWHSFMHGRRPK
jgi:hypothetical protein